MEDMDDSTSDPAERHHESIRIAAILLAAAIAAVAALGIHEYQQAAPARGRVGAQIDAVLSGRIGFINIVDVDQYPDWKEFLKQKGDLASVDPYGLSIAYSHGVNAALKQIEGEPRIRWLDLIETDLSDAGAESIASLPDLEGLAIYLGNLTDAGLAKLRSCPRLERLTLCLAEAKQVTVSAILGLPHLRRLTLTVETDAGPWPHADLMELKKGQSLKELVLVGDSVAASDVEELAAALPQCNVVAKTVDQAAKDAAAGHK
jgi:hypothetical protein